MKLSTISLLGFISAAPLSHAVSLSITGSIFSVNGSDGQALPDGSLVELGFFNEVDATLAPTAYTDVEWGSFTVIDTGVTERLFTVFEGGVSFNTTVDSAMVLGGNDADIPVRVGARFYDAAAGTFNTIVRSDDLAILELPFGNPTVAGSGTADINARSTSADAATLFIWEDEGAAFMAAIAIPEPSSSVTLLLGLGLLSGRRRRS